ncbi:NUDIX domain-containing protein [Actinokineospora enzanensis]|uniref:NUDIX domain-containing protein n=1 Tax=Actinokineospora enzanensis TaxID=155975 RepID=UPI0006872366|nr:NUDIX domain-containing protein [Actinokineospora enzanensis]
MSHSHSHSRLPVEVEVFTVSVVRLIEVAPPVVPDEHVLERDRLWAETAGANPALFDGPVVACADLRVHEAGEVVVSWARVTYRHFALRWVVGARAWGSVFVSVAQPTTRGGVVVDRMSSSTAAAGRWQFSGGSAEQPAVGVVLEEAHLRAHAARELAEEVGVVVDPSALRLWVLTRGEHGNIGVFYLAPPLPFAEITARFEATVASERAAGREPEFAEISTVDSPTELAELPGRRVDYLGPLVDRLSSE